MCSISLHSLSCCILMGGGGFRKVSSTNMYRQSPTGAKLSISNTHLFAYFTLTLISCLILIFLSISCESCSISEHSQAQLLKKNRIRSIKMKLQGIQEPQKSPKRSLKTKKKHLDIWKPASFCIKCCSQ